MIKCTISFACGTLRRDGSTTLFFKLLTLSLFLLDSNDWGLIYESVSGKHCVRI